MNTEKKYNDSLTLADLERQEEFDPQAMLLMTYRGPNDTCEGFASGKLGNMAGGFPHTVLGHLWKGTEYLYLMGEWSNNTADHLAIQEDVLTAKNGYAAKQFKKAKHHKKIRSDFKEFRKQWMLWCIWQKCQLNAEFAALLSSVPEDHVIVEVVKRDPVWAAYPDEDGIIRGGNAMGKLLTICKRCLATGTEPAIDRQMLNDAEIYILGKKVVF